MTNFSISIVSDTVCPWCYVGKKKLDRAIALYKSAHPNTSDTFTTTWLPYYLNPDAPSPGVDKKKYLESKFGVQRAAQMTERLALIAKSVGIDFKSGGKTGATRNSHRLLELGKQKGADAQNRVVQELFTRYFEQEQDISDIRILREAGAKAGLGEESEIQAWLESDEGGKEVDNEVHEAQRKGVTGVPHFTIQGKYEISGAQDPEGFARIFEQIKAKDRG